MSACRTHANMMELAPTYRTPTPAAAQPPTPELTVKLTSVRYVLAERCLSGVTFFVKFGDFTL